MPVEKYFELCANYIQEYELIRGGGGVIPEMSSEENYKNESNSFKNNNRKNFNKNIEIEEKLKLNLEAKNDSLKNNQ